ncbi:LapA family protein [Reinekea thalattae]|uniref:LapA family protein n=1 Tax=Reinekea thalattae TaxID=2593301 RepID=A0A5C8Z4X2_9GAMM|nr:LapA family protein [Reinekea thalattae]
MRRIPNLRLTKWLLFVGVLVLGWLLGWSNSNLIQLQFLFWRSPEIPIYLVLLMTFFIGLILGVLLGYFSRRSRSSKNE